MARKTVKAPKGDHSTPPPPLTNAQETARSVCERYGNKPDELLEILHAIQHELGYVPEECLPQIADALNLSRAEVYGVISFYHDYKREPIGRHLIKLCRAEACQAMGTNALCAHAEKKLGAAMGETSKDGAFTLEAVYCLGNCALSPAMMIGEKLYGRLDAKRFDAIVDTLKAEAAE